MITLYQFSPVWGLPNASPFCMKVETYLRMAGLPYQVKTVSNPAKAPKGKLPYIKVDGTTVADSEFIIEFLGERFGKGLDNALTAEQRAQAVLLENTFSERLFWCMVYARWQSPFGWEHTEPAYFKGIPWPLSRIIPNQFRKKMLKALFLQGMGRHNLAEILFLSDKTLQALSTYLGLDNYFMGECPSTIDATAFAFLANLAWLPFDDPLKEQLSHYRNLQEFCERMWLDYYPERKPPFPLNEIAY